MWLKYVKIREFELGLYFRDGEFRGLLEAGRYLFLNLPFARARVEGPSGDVPPGASVRRSSVNARVRSLRAQWISE